MVVKNKRIVCCGDFNGDTKISHVSIMKQLGFSRVNFDPTYSCRKKDGGLTHSHNDQIWVLKVRARLHKQIRSDLYNNGHVDLKDPEITIESPHDCLIFEITEFKQKLYRPMLLYPSDEKLEEFKQVLKSEIAASRSVHKIDTFYSA